MSAFDVDPTAATSPDFNRRTFVGVTAAASAGLGMAARGLAEPSSPMGRAHPPQVPEDDPAISAEKVEFTVDGTKIPAYSARPRHAGPATPSVVVVMHVWGVDTSIRDVVRRFAKAGIAAIAPDLYARFGSPDGDGSTDSAPFRAVAKQLVRAQYVADIRAAAAWLAAASPSTKTGILGFCMGGHLALLTAIDTRRLFAAVFPFYGAVEGVSPEALEIPVCGSYGARDTSIPAAGVRAFAAALAVPNDIRIYDDAGHAFFDDQRASYVADAAADAWKRALAFLETYAGAPTP
jgi:carboxymethylenebutenolidase